jgi:hypothetical protein
VTHAGISSAPSMDAQPDPVLEDMRRRIRADGQGPPEGDPYGRVVRRGKAGVRHAQSFEKSSSSRRWVSEYQLPLSSRKIASMPYGRSCGSWMNSTPRARNVS